MPRLEVMNDFNRKVLKKIKLFGFSLETSKEITKPSAALKSVDLSKIEIIIFTYGKLPSGKIIRQVKFTHFIAPGQTKPEKEIFLLPQLERTKFILLALEPKKNHIVQPSGVQFVAFVGETTITIKLSELFKVS